jgi:hypothetical protein
MIHTCGADGVAGEFRGDFDMSDPVNGSRMQILEASRARRERLTRALYEQVRRGIFRILGISEHLVLTPTRLPLDVFRASLLRVELFS